jgi:hypothetical protein
MRVDTVGFGGTETVNSTLVDQIEFLSSVVSNWTSEVVVIAGEFQVAFAGWYTYWLSARNAALAAVGYGSTPSTAVMSPGPTVPAAGTPERTYNTYTSQKKTLAYLTTGKWYKFEIYVKTGP